MTLLETISGQSADEYLLAVQNLKVHYPVKMPFIQRLLMREKPVVHAVDGVTFTLRRGEIFGLVGESGCGKTTVGRAIVRLVEPTSGEVRLDGEDITHRKEKDLRDLRRKAQIIFQDPHASLNPAMTIGRAIGHPLEIHGITPTGPVQAVVDEGVFLPVASEIQDAVLGIMREVGLTPAEQLYEKYPADLSGGQKQRAAIARAMILRPSLIVADEPVSMLDMSIRARVLELMLDLKRRHGLTYLFITHDLATAKFICDRIAIMYLGRIVEMGSAKEIYADPKHPYTKALLQAIPIPDPAKRRQKSLPKGEVPDAVYPPAGCRFHPRCPVALPTCGWEGRDFVDYLEERRLGPSKVASEEAAFGLIDDWWASGFEAGRRVAESQGGDLLARIRAALAEAPAPLAGAVQDVLLEEGEAIVRFRPADPLEPRLVEGRLVECLLY